MNISLNDWTKYKNTLSRLSSKAGEEFRDHFFRNNSNGLSNVSLDEVIQYAYALITKYGEGSAELACQMYDAIAELEEASVAAAIPAETASMNEVPKAVNGAMKQSPTGQLLEGVVQRLVKQAGADTTLKNAVRDRAQFAWIPTGDTCAFCITLASRGWQYASQNSLKNGHAEHIHAHCDCQYAIRFNENTNVSGYDPDKYLRMYNSYDGKPQDKINAMRRAMYKESRERELPTQLGFVYNGKQEFIPKNAVITKAKAIAGKGSSTVFRNAQNYADAYGGESEDWRKMVGTVESDKFLFDVHWAETEEKKVIEPKIKNFKRKENED